ncbi:iron-sulfur cluster biosynthesis family protein [Paenibacillus agri]|uniref:Iron-sulfur cluster biosynthesis family protein n=1 Tax=Paenibacillus agri TaxID=2744309 RepID=A0A850ERT1_9BACL|nr:iron-sulfur cluster biosynthesis family protein [Paenibacillus agri]NUU61462.1 iron-sulfur cluster biosynthesis family protein [Paenibacillus agri]
MIIQVTPLAERKLKERLGDQPGIFKLFYDTQGCGCDGINVLLIVDQAGPEDLRIDAGGLPFIVSRQQEIFYEDKMRLDGEERFTSFKLDSDSQIYGKNILIRDIRGTEAPLPGEGAACPAEITR